MVKNAAPAVLGGKADHILPFWQQRTNGIRCAGSAADIQAAGFGGHFIRGALDYGNIIRMAIALQAVMILVK